MSDLCSSSSSSLNLFIKESESESETVLMFGRGRLRVSFYVRTPETHHRAQSGIDNTREVIIVMTVKVINAVIEEAVLIISEQEAEEEREKEGSELKK